MATLSISIVDSQPTFADLSTKLVHGNALYSSIAFLALANIATLFAFINLLHPPSKPSLRVQSSACFFLLLGFLTTIFLEAEIDKHIKTLKSEPGFFDQATNDALKEADENADLWATILIFLGLVLGTLSVAALIKTLRLSHNICIDVRQVCLALSLVFLDVGWALAVVAKSKINAKAETLMDMNETARAQYGLSMASEQSLLASIAIPFVLWAFCALAVATITLGFRVMENWPQGPAPQPERDVESDAGVAEIVEMRRMRPRSLALSRASTAAETETESVAEPETALVPWSPLASERIVVK